ncbi:16S rRNA (guanine(527)-N(7))-methyltransferase RsmG [Psychrobium sp. 1_MG-2023]|uniref:16S rRNA (guanine(527)-N(7))-methyltransferase RsmG n=1 Tax=Psychrobium sp. 1_MG-2023 TaxID=3062624 RepID=UPI0026D55DAB|nr:16S rRNA (guanine(527)-N(7))-methyltransferase RsmG [Psychrobium sp. 1_MG-2023]MDP2560459.1 16S rRNA (guanine(527)-N(7))-methyltransferase RsmG [Psychrobium sp. 1_MG-2023]
MLAQQLQRLINDSQLSVSEPHQQQLVQLVELLNKWNKAYNLTSVRNPSEMLVKHIMDSIVVSPHLDGHCFIDVGTGPGLPGLPLAILNPDKQFYLLDSLGKRIRFIKQVVHELGLKNVTPIQSRVEEFTPANDEWPQQGFDGVLSRAFASLDDMLDWCHHLPNQQGKFYALKGVIPQAELDHLREGLSLDVIHQLVVPELEGERHLVIIQQD